MAKQFYKANITKKQAEQSLNELGVPEHDKRSNGGLIPDRTQNYGSWLRRNDPIAFYYAIDDMANAHGEWR